MYICVKINYNRNRSLNIVKKIFALLTSNVYIIKIINPVIYVSTNMFVFNADLVHLNINVLNKDIQISKIPMWIYLD